MKNNSFDAKTILSWSEEQLWELDKIFSPTEEIVLYFNDDDIEIVTNVSAVIFSWYLWGLHRKYPKTRLLSDHFVTTVPFNGNMVTTMLTIVVKSVRDAYYNSGLDIERLAQDIQITINEIYNMAVRHLSEYVDTMDAYDCIEVVYSPEIKQLHENCIANDGSNKAIRTLYDNIPKVMKRDEYLPGNPLVMRVKYGLSKIGQVLQFIGVRGYVTDINSAMFKYPILSSFVEGINKAPDFIKESRSASKALLFQTNPIKKTEYFNRRLQLSNQFIKYIFKGDCGTSGYLEFRIEPGDLKSLEGKYYIEEGTNLLKVITVDPLDHESRALVGKTVRLRSPITCDWKHKQGACQTCCGQLVDTLPAGTNLGHVAAYTIGEKITQAVLSVKHHDGSTEIKEISLEPKDRNYVRLGKNCKENILFTNKVKELVKEHDVKILLAIKDVGNITQAMKASHISESGIFKISTIEKIKIEYELDEDMEVGDWVVVSGPSRPSSLSLPMLEYIRKYNYEQTDSKYIEISLKHWDFDEVAFVLPQKHVNMLDFMKRLEEMIEFKPESKKSARKGRDAGNPEDMAAYIRELYDYCTSQIKVNLLYLEVITLAGLVKDHKHGDFSIPTNNSEMSFTSSDNIKSGRSVSCVLAYERQNDSFIGNGSYKSEGTVSHPLDALFSKNSEDEMFDKWYSE